MSFNTIKVEFGSQLRRLAFDYDCSSWTAIRSQILSSYAVNSQSDMCALHYLDDEGDLISVNSDTEFEEAMRCAKQKGKILKLILSKSEKPTTAPSNTATATVSPSVSVATSSSSSSAVEQPQEQQEDEKAALLKVSVDVHSDGGDVDVEEVRDEDGDGVEQQVEEMDLPLSRRDLLSKSPTLSEASDSSFVSINAQSLRDDLDEKDEQAVEGANDSEVLAVVAAASKDEVKEAVVVTAAATPSQPEFIPSDRAVVEDVLKKLAEDPIQLKSASPKATPATQIEEKRVTPEPQVGKDEAKSPLDNAAVTSGGMKVKELRSVIEGVIHEMLPSWLEDLLSYLENLDHADEDVKRVRQLTQRIRFGLATKQPSLQRISDGVAKNMMRAMKLADGKPLKSKDKAKKLAEKPQPKEDEEKKTKASPPTPIVQTPPVISSTAAAVAATATPSNCCASSAVGGAVHRGITCDGCGMSPICGVRFHCISCDQITKVRQAGGFDLCESCESAGIHREVDGKAHVMIKIKQPTNVIVDIEAPVEPISGPQVYDVLRVNADGTRVPFCTAQPVIALPPSSSSSASLDEKSNAMSGAAAKVAELEERIRALEGVLKNDSTLSALQVLVKADAKRKAEKQAEKEQKRKDKEERRKTKQEAAARAKAARAEARQKMKDEKLAAKRAAAEKMKAEAEAIKQQQEKDKQAEVPKTEEKKDASLGVAVKVESQPLPVSSNAASSAAIVPSASAVATTTATAPVSAPPAPTSAVAEKVVSASSASVSASAPAPAPAAPFNFTLPQFPFSNMVNSITSTVSNTFATAPFPFGNHTNGKQPTQAQPPASAPFLPSAPAPQALAHTPATLANANSASSSSSSSLSSIWSSPLTVANGNGSQSVNNKRTLADVRAPAFFPYMVQLRDLESMGFDVDKSIHALRYYGGDIQKAINSML